MASGPPVPPDARRGLPPRDRVRGLLTVLALVIAIGSASGTGVWGVRAGPQPPTGSAAAVASPSPGGTGGSEGVTPTPGIGGSASPPVSPAASPTSDPNDAVHVSVDGSDGGAGTATDPWRTIQHAVDSAPDGSTILIGPGRFDGFTVARSGLAIRGTSGATLITGKGDVILLTGVDGCVISDVDVTGASTSFAAGILVDTSRDVVIERSVLHGNRSFGIRAVDSTDVVIRDNDIHGNETGIELARAGDGIVIEGNRIHENDRMVDASRGGNAIVFYLTTGAILVTGNEIWGNRAPTAAEPGYDGGAFEVYGASNLTISGNTLWDNNNALETGTDGSRPCSGNTFIRNVVRGPGSVPEETEGMILRCADRMLVAHNTFDGVDTYAFYITASGLFSGPIEGLRIVNNIVVRGRALSLAADLPAGLVIDYNVLDPGGSSAKYGNQLAYVEGVGTTDSIAVLRTWTGFEEHGLQVDPAFVGPSEGDYRLAADSPAIDRGLDLGQPFEGAAPDPGRHEHVP